MRWLLPLVFLSSIVLANANPNLPKNLENVGVKERLGEDITLSIPFVQEEGQPASLADYVVGKRPIVVMMGYFECPKLCSLILDGFSAAARAVTWTLGQEYDFVMVSIDPKEDSHIAAKKKDSYVRTYGRANADKGIHFLTGTQESIRQLADELGFRYHYDDRLKQFIHPAVLAVLSPEGRITRYLYGIEFRSKDLKLALLEGAKGRVGTTIERLLLMCYQYDPNAGSYSVAIMNLLKIAAIGTILMIGFLIWFLRRQEPESLSKKKTSQV